MYQLLSNQPNFDTELELILCGCIQFVNLIDTNKVAKTELNKGQHKHWYEIQKIIFWKEVLTAKVNKC